MNRPVNIAPEDHFPVIVDGDDIAMIGEAEDEGETFIELRSRSGAAPLLIAMKENMTAQGIAEKLAEAGVEMIPFPARSSSQYVNPAAVCYFAAGDRTGQNKEYVQANIVLQGGVAGTSALSAAEEEVLAEAIKRHIPRAMEFTKPEALIVNHHVSDIGRALCDPGRITRVYCSGSAAGVEFANALLHFKGFVEMNKLPLAAAAMELADNDPEIQAMAETDMRAAWREALRRTKALFAREEEDYNKVRDAFVRRVAAEAGLDEFEGASTPSFMRFADIRRIYIHDNGDAFTMDYTGSRPGETERANVDFRSPEDMQKALKIYECRMTGTDRLPVIPAWPQPKPPRPESP